jgi:exodeoxyribonuclease III
MKIATFNTNSLRSRLDIIRIWLKENQPDVLAVQETKVQDADFPIEACEDTGYHVIFRGQKAYNGVAIFSKSTPEQVVSHLPGDPTDQARFLKAKIENITVLNTYVPQGREVDSEYFDYKLKWFGWLREYLDAEHDPAEPLVWVGDLNVAREDIDVYNPKGLWGHVCFCQPVQDALKHVMDWGLTDLFRRFCPEPGHYTFWDYRVLNALERNMGWRLDYIMATQPCVEACRSCRIDKTPRGWPKPSDHTFLEAGFALS